MRYQQLVEQHLQKQSATNELKQKLRTLALKVKIALCHELGISPDHQVFLEECFPSDVVSLKESDTQIDINADSTISSEELPFKFLVNVIIHDSDSQYEPMHRSYEVSVVGTLEEPHYEFEGRSIEGSAAKAPKEIAKQIVNDLEIELL